MKPEVPKRQTTQREDAGQPRSAHLNIKIAAQRFDDAVEEICQRHGISQAQYGILWVICLSPKSKRGVPVKEVADGLITRASDATRLIDRLEAAGLVERLNNPDDRRSVLVRATTQGRRSFTAVSPEIEKYHHEAWAHLTSQDLATLDRLLLKALWGEPGAT